jgi:hypothetical protein
LGNSSTIVDFVQGATINVQNIFPYVTVTGMMVVYQYDAWSANGVQHPAPTVTFTLDTAMHDGHQWLAWKDASDNFIVTRSNGNKTITAPVSFLYPGSPAMAGQLEAFGGTPLKMEFMYTGTEYKYENLFTSSDFTGATGFGGFVTPWAGISTSDKDSVIFNVNWNLTNLIEQRCTTWDGVTANHSCSSCVYVLANKFWERFSFTVD